MRWQGGTRVLVRSMSSSGKGSPPTYCRELVRTTDHEHYIATLLLPEKLRSATFAIRALGSEVAGVRDSVSDRTLGMVRTQFWKDAVANMYQEGKTVPNHPVVTEVKRLVDTSPQPSQKLLQDLVGSRDSFLADRPFSSLEQVEQYGEAAFSSIYLLLLELLGNDNGHAKHAATQLGKCEGLVTLLRGTPYNVSKRRVYLPSDLMMEQGVREEGVLRRGPLEDGIRDVVEVVASRAQHHLEAARLRSKFLAAEHKLLLLPCVAADHYLDQLSKVECNLWDKSLHTRNSKLPMALAWHKLKRTY